MEYDIGMVLVSMPTFQLTHKAVIKDAYDFCTDEINNEISLSE